MRKLFTIVGIAAIVLSANAKTIDVAPGGKNKIKDAIKAASSGDTIKLSAGEYKEDTLIIDKKIAIKGPKITLPALDAKAIIRPAKGLQVNALFILKNACDLVLQYVKIDGVGSKGAFFSPFAQSTGNWADMTISVYVDHCRLMNTFPDTLNPASPVKHGAEVGNVFDIANKNIAINGKQVQLAKCHFTNNIFENIHGRCFYLHEYFGPNDILIKNNTFINTGFQVFAAGKLLMPKNSSSIKGKVVFDNNTVWKIGSINVGKNTIGVPAYEIGKEIIAGIAEAASFTYSIQNNIFAHQIFPSSGPNEGAVPSVNAGTTNFWFQGSVFAHELSLKNNVMHEMGIVYVIPIASTAAADMCVTSNIHIKDETWPKFADTTKLNFTIGESTMVSNGKAIKGAEWWAPGYDETTGVAKAQIAKLSVSPNPVVNALYVNGASKIEVVDLTGKIALSIKGETVNVSILKSGVYIVRANVKGEILVAKVVKK